MSKLKKITCIYCYNAFAENNIGDKIKQIECPYCQNEYGVNLETGEIFTQREKLREYHKKNNIVEYFIYWDSKENRPILKSL